MSSSFGKPAKASPLKKAFRVAVAVVVLGSGWADYQYYTPDATKDKVGAWVENKTGSELLGEAFGHKQATVTQSVEKQPAAQPPAPKAP